MRRPRNLNHAIVVFLIACLLRALLPIDAGTSTAARAARDEGAYPCAGHACGCHSRERCLAECCCFPAHTSDRHEPASAASLAARVPASVAVAAGERHEPRSRESSVRDGRCGGGSPLSLAPASSFVSIEPAAVEWGVRRMSALAPERVEFEAFASRRPDPSTPPPRVPSSRA